MGVEYKMNREEREKLIFEDSMAALKGVYFVHKAAGASNKSILRMIARASVKMDVDVINRPNK